MAKLSYGQVMIIFQMNQSLSVVGEVLAKSLWSRLFKARAWDVGFDSSNRYLVDQPKSLWNGLAALYFFYLYLSERLDLFEVFG